MIFPPMWLHKYAVYLVEADDLFAVADGFKHNRDTQIAGAPENALRGAYDQLNGVIAESIVSEFNAIELGIDEGFDIVGVEAGYFDRIRDAAADVLVDSQSQLVHQGGLGDQYQVVALGEVLEQESELA